MKDLNRRKVNPAHALDAPPLSTQDSALEASFSSMPRWDIHSLHAAGIKRSRGTNLRAVLICD